MSDVISGDTGLIVRLLRSRYAPAYFGFAAGVILFAALETAAAGDYPGAFALFAFAAVASVWAIHTSRHA